MQVLSGSNLFNIAFLKSVTICKEYSKYFRINFTDWRVPNIWTSRYRKSVPVKTSEIHKQLPDLNIKKKQSSKY